jgi:flavin reductase (DIM6/NTAB) family NADH-FMN oxidoreductase RutF
LGSRTLEAVRGGNGDFTISVLSRTQEAVARDFGRSLAEFPHSHVLRDDDGHPHVKASLAYLKCRTYSTIRLGDHDVIVGEVKNFGVNEGDPLVFHRGSYAMLGAAGIR